MLHHPVEYDQMICRRVRVQRGRATTHLEQDRGRTRGRISPEDRGLSARTHGGIERSKLRIFEPLHVTGLSGRLLSLDERRRQRKKRQDG